MDYAGKIEQIIFAPLFLHGDSGAALGVVALGRILHAASLI
jgi:hypothetical protein